MSEKRNIISIASGKTGVGKTWLSINLANALSYLKQKILFFDGDLGFMNIDAQLGVAGDLGIYDVILGDNTLNQIVCSSEKVRFDIVAGKSGLANLESLPIGRLQMLCEDLLLFSDSYDNLIVDLGNGMTKPAAILGGLATRAIVVCTDDPDSIVDGYEFVKNMTMFNPKTEVEIVINQVNSIREGQRHYETLLKACELHLNISPSLLGVVRRDSRVRDAIRNKTTMIQRYPVSEATEDIFHIAKKIVSYGDKYAK